MSRSFSLFSRGPRPKTATSLALLAVAVALPGTALAQAPAAPEAPVAEAPSEDKPAEPAPSAPGTVVEPSRAAPPPVAQPLPSQRRVPADSVSDVDPIDIPPEHDPLAHAWDRPEDRGGFYLRLSTSLGVHNTRLGPAPWNSDAGREAHGFGTGYGLDVGGFLAPWVALHLDATAGMLWNGKLHYEYDRADDDGDRVRVAAFGIAPAVTFFAPHGFFFKGAFGVGMARVRVPGPDNTTDVGFYMDMAAGKDLYVGRNVSLGLQFQVVYMHLGDEEKLDEARVRQYLFGFSVGFDSI